MSAIFLPRRWRHQPQGAAELASWLPAGTIAFLGSQRRVIGAAYSEVGAITQSVGPEGLGLASTTKSSAIETSRVRKAQTDGFSLIAQFRRTGSSYRAIAGTADSGNNYAERLAVNIDDGIGNRAGTVGFLLRTADLNLVRFTQLSGITTAGKVHTVAITVTSATTCAMWMDGQPIGLQYNNRGFGYSESDPTAMSAVPLALLSYNVEGSAYDKGDWGDLFCYARIERRLDSGALRELSLDPYGQIFRAPARRIIFDLGASPVPVLSLPGVTEIGQTSARPKVAITWPE